MLRSFKHFLSTEKPVVLPWLLSQLLDVLACLTGSHHFPKVERSSESFGRHPEGDSKETPASGVKKSLKDLQSEIKLLSPCSSSEFIQFKIKLSSPRFTKSF
ncbi:hypothetical protein M9H77_18039 [Catharanthus roseus]|uniref:Uncharacterized protein n=1 Tax=Catharanthus roseus TaxID=4058 RepID=A0ACC0B6C7_CATRO|nr:hypothetical protein M9H77_18039 [Catharanthus roseus]